MKTLDEMELRRMRAREWMPRLVHREVPAKARTPWNRYAALALAGFAAGWLFSWLVNS